MNRSRLSSAMVIPRGLGRKRRWWHRVRGVRLERARPRVWFGLGEVKEVLLLLLLGGEDLGSCPLALLPLGLLAEPALLPLLLLYSPLQSFPKTQYLALRNTKLPIQHSQKLPLDAAYVALAKDARAESPVHVLERRVVEVLGRGDEGAKEDALEGPLFEGDVEVGTSAVDVDECGEEGGGGYFCAGEDGGGEGGELGLEGCACAGSGGAGSW